SARLTNTTISPNGFLYYNVSFTRVITSGMDINTEADIRSGTEVLGKIPIRLKISVKGAGVSVDCTELYDGADCMGGICCLGVCRAHAECCPSTASIDCGTGKTCGVDYKCSSGIPNEYCSSGSTCRTGLTDCPSGETKTGTCATGGSIGICCEEEDECSGKADMESCYSGDGVCCSGECQYWQCCGLDSECGAGKECRSNFCYDKENGGEEFDFTLILIIAVIALAGVGVWWYLTKYKKKGSSGEEELKEGDEVFDEEEFY
ncbi:MAG: hypothetical protein KAT35_01545, partial [Candidatus Aenigmarchaeota archaeon]|nr:hypothetical protein [Candidatus Aenigmarchaeota archaeon]